jgi:probable Rubsico expression protein CbbX
MWTVRRSSGLGVFLLVVAGAALLGWLRLSHAVFMAAAFCAAFVVSLLGATWNTWRQTSPASLGARGIDPDDRNLRVYDPGLRRERAPLVRPAVSRRLSGKRIPHRPGQAPAPRGPATFPAAQKAVSAPTIVPASAVPAGPNPAKARTAGTAKPGVPASSGRGRKRNDSLRPDATVDFASERRAADIDDVFAALDSQLVGLVPVKKKVEEIGSLLMVDRARQRFGLSAPRPNLHMCFTGPPGTGKTTVALMMADLLHRLGYLESGHLVHAMRDDLVGEYIGQTAPRTKHVLGRAMGGVLFIDEAYSLHRAEDSRDYGQECVEILMQVMENERSSLVVILAGYKDRMDKFFESSPGMKSRIAHHLDFAAYSTDELLAIGRLMIDRSSYYLSDEAMAVFRDYLSLHRTDSDFANARTVRNALEAARLRHAFRLASEPDRPWSMDDLMRLERSDLLADLDGR